MTFKNDSKTVAVDWNAVNIATEITRTYEIHLNAGGIMFKMYKPSIFKKILPIMSKSGKWKSAKMVGVRA